MNGPSHLLTFSLRTGAAVWFVFFALYMAGRIIRSPLNLLLLLAVLVITPLALRLLAHPARPTGQHGLYGVVAVWQPLAALPAAIALLLSVGWPAALLVVPWFLFTLAVAGYGLRWLAIHWDVTEERVIGAGLIMVAVGGFWLLFARAGRPLLAFGEPLVTLTAIHFHYITLAALVIGGMTGRFLRQPGSAAFRLYRAAAAGLILAPPLVALGITFSIALEAIATILLALSLSLLAGITLRYVVPALGLSWPAALLALSGISVVAAMLFATVYAVGRVTGA